MGTGTMGRFADSRGARMARWQHAIVLCAIVLLGGCAASTGSAGAGDRDAVSSPASRAGRTASIRIPPQPAGADAPVRIVLTREMARRALAEGELSIELADGTRYPVRMERGYDEGGDRWTVVGRVRTVLGPQSAVLTFGPDAVFGVLPRPDGRSFAITTVHGAVRIAPAGAMVPKGKAPMQDFVVPSGPGAGTAAAASLAGPASRRATGPASHAVAPASSAPAAVRVDMLGLYDSALVALRGTASAAETELTSMVAIANQAHRDSGSVVHLALVGMREIAIPAGEYNQQVLDDIANNRIAGVDIAALRDAAGADLVFAARPYTEGDATCGIGYLAGAEQQRNYLDPRWGYSVGNVDPCGPYVLAHETGHNLGSQHDRQTASWTIDRIAVYGAFPYSFGYRHEDPPGFATIMAYQFDLPWIGYFSNPASAACGATCGIEGRADNVRSLAQIAPVVAAFRGGAPGTVSILDASVVEQGKDTNPGLWVPVRLSSAAPAGGVDVEVRVMGGTAKAYNGGDATSGADYFTVSPYVHIEEGEHDGLFFLAAIGDDDAEGDETIQLKLIRAKGASMADRDAVVTIIDDDPQPLVEGRLLFPEGYPPPATPVELRVRGAGESVRGERTLQVQPPDFRYAIPFQPGNDISLNAFPPAPFAAAQLDLGQVDAPMNVDYPLVPGVTVSGRVRVPAGGSSPVFPMDLRVSEAIDTYGRPQRDLWLDGPEATFSFQVVPGAAISLQVPSPGAPYQPFLLSDANVLANVVHDVTLSTLPSMVIWGTNDLPSEGPNHPSALVSLSAPAGPGGASVSYRTEAGTALPGEDYAPVSGVLAFAPGETLQFIPLETYADALVEDDEYFEVVLEDPHGAVLTTSRFRLDIPNDDVLGADPLPVLSLEGDGVVPEGAAGTDPSVGFVAVLSAPAPEGGATVSYRAVAGTATLGEDFGAAEGALVFAAGESRQTILVPIYGDDVVEGDEYLDLVATPLRGVAPGEVALRITLRDDDAAAPPPPPSTPPPSTPPPAPPPPPPADGGDGGQQPSGGECLSASLAGSGNRKGARPCR